MDLFLYDRDLRDERGKRNLQALYSILKFEFLYAFHATDLFLYPLKTLKNLFIFSFQGVWKETSAMKWVNALRTPPEINKTQHPNNQEIQLHARFFTRSDEIHGSHPP